jgi:hypothetical protein
MSTFPSNVGNPYDPYGGSVPQKTSGLAIASLVCSLCGIITCGITSLIGALLGLIGLITIGKDPARKGKGMAAAGLILGILISAGWGVGIFFVGKFFSDIYQFMVTGPTPALQAGFNGDIPGFKAEFSSTVTATDDEARAFIAEMTSRYGVFSGGQMNQQKAPPQPAPGQPKIAVPYVLQFSGASVDAMAELEFADPNTGFTKKLLYIQVIDPVKGDLWYPLSAAPAAPAPGTASPVTPPSTVSP